MRVLVLSNRYPNAAKPYAAMFVKRHCQLHEELGVQVNVLVSTLQPKASYSQRMAGFVNFLGKALDAAISNDFDVVHAHWPFPAGIVACALAKLRRKPFIVTSHGAFVDDFEKQPWHIQQSVKYVFQQADVIIAVGNRHRRKLLEVAEVAEDKVHTIHMGVWGIGTAPDRTTARKKLALPTDKQMIIFVGNLENVKGPDILLEAVNKIPISERKFQLFIGGQGPLRPQLEKFVETHGLQTMTHFLGAIPPEEVLTWLAAADLCVVPSRSEAFGLVAVEAMNSGTAVIATDVGGLRENIEHNKNGLLFPFEDSTTLAQSIQRMLGDSDLRSHLARTGYNTAYQFDMKTQAQRVYRIYVLLLSKFPKQSNLFVKQ